MLKINLTCHKSRHPIMQATPTTEYINTSSVYKYSQVFQNKKKKRLLLMTMRKSQKYFVIICLQEHEQRGVYAMCAMWHLIKAIKTCASGRGGEVGEDFSQNIKLVYRTCLGGSKAQQSQATKKKKKATLCSLSLLIDWAVRQAPYHEGRRWRRRRRRKDSKGFLLNKLWEKRFKSNIIYFLFFCTALFGIFWLDSIRGRWAGRKGKGEKCGQNQS